MSITSEYPFEPNPGASGGGSGRRAGHAAPPSVAGGLLGALAILVGSGLVGLAGGYAWAHLAPKAVYIVVSHGSADVVNPETSAFIAADAWFCLIGVAGGLIIGLAGYLLAVRRHGPAPMAAILAGSVIAAITARWVGEHQGLHQFDQQLLTVHQGTLLHAPLALAGDTSAAIWPPAPSLPAVAFWPLAACVVAGGIVLMGVLRDRSAARRRGEPVSMSSQFPFHPDQ
jgi:xanthosine utilization system XapX-like protein